MKFLARAFCFTGEFWTLPLSFSHSLALSLSLSRLPAGHWAAREAAIAMSGSSLVATTKGGSLHSAAATPILILSDPVISIFLQGRWLFCVSCVSCISCVFCAFVGSVRMACACLTSLFPSQQMRTISFGSRMSRPFAVAISTTMDRFGSVRCGRTLATSMETVVRCRVGWLRFVFSCGRVERTLAFPIVRSCLEGRGGEARAERARARGQGAQDQEGEGEGRQKEGPLRALPAFELFGSRLFLYSRRVLFRAPRAVGSRRGRRRHSRFSLRSALALPFVLATGRGPFGLAFFLHLCPGEAVVF